MKKHFSLMLFVLISLTTVAQNNSPTTIETINKTLLIQELKDGNTSLNHTIAGNPYLNKDFQDGKLIGKFNLTFPVVPLRYNIYTDNIEYKSRDNKVYELEGREKIKAYKIGDTTFIYSPYFKNKSNLSSGYFQVLVSGKATGLIKYTVYLLEAQPERPYKPARSERFSQMTKSFYVKVDDDPAVPISRKKDILQLFPKQKSQLSQYIKKENIRVQKQAGFLKLVSYINTLTGYSTAGNKK